MSKKMVEDFLKNHGYSSNFNDYQIITPDQSDDKIKELLISKFGPNYAGNVQALVQSNKGEVFCTIFVRKKIAA